MNPASLPESVRTPTLSICVPTYNRARYLECMLADLAANIGGLGFSYELLIGDNGSEDDTAEVVRAYEGQLAIRYFRRPENLGPFHNFSQLLAAAQGKYFVYLADDDLLMIEVLGRYIAHLEANPGLGAVFAPWYIHDRVTGEDLELFYSVPEETRIEARDHRSLFAWLVNGHVFPEIYVVKTSLARAVTVGANDFAFFYFVQIAAMVDRAAVTFCPEPFYRQVSRYFDDDSRSQTGIEEVKIGWDRYRGGLEYILAKFASQLSPEDLEWCHRAIDRFVQIRMHVALRLRTLDGRDWVDNYYIANRLRCTGGDSLLPAPYHSYRVNAALEYLCGLQPFFPRPATVAYYKDDAPHVLAQAQDFATADLLALEDRSEPLSDDVIIVGSRDRLPTDTNAFVISEAELLARFP